MQHYVDGQSNIGSMCDYKPCRSVGLVSFGGNQELTVIMVQVQEGMAVSKQGQHYVKLKEGHADQRGSFKLSSC